MNVRNRRRLATLQRRLEHLDNRIRDGASKGMDLSYDKQERAALKWILQSFANAEQSTPQRGNNGYAIPASSKAMG